MDEKIGDSLFFLNEIQNAKNKKNDKSNASEDFGKNSETIPKEIFNSILKTTRSPIVFSEDKLVLSNGNGIQRCNICMSNLQIDSSRKCSLCSQFICHKCQVKMEMEISISKNELNNNFICKLCSFDQNNQ